MMTYKADGRFITLTTTGKTTDAERQAVYEAIRADPNVPDGAFLVIDIRKYEILLTQLELQRRVSALLEGLSTKVGTSCAIIVGDASLRVGLSFQLVAANSNFRVGVFHDEAGARNWLDPDA
jgi:hypothetical protein